MRIVGIITPDLPNYGETKDGTFHPSALTTTTYYFVTTFFVFITATTVPLCLELDRERDTSAIDLSLYVAQSCTKPSVLLLLLLATAAYNYSVPLYNEM